MITPAEADEVAGRVIAEYIRRCGAHTREDVANALMKMASASGLAMIHAVGHEGAADRMRGVAGFVASDEAAELVRRATTGVTH
jgi:hypothetical protein